ncbi:MAG: sigma-70 family RNA polymerase sigma factor [Planctomycetota bacterium]
MTESADILRSGLDRHSADLSRLVAREAGWLLRLESPEDLVQGAAGRILGAASGFEDRGDKELFGFLATLTRHYLSDRRDHWKAQRRDAAAVLRVTSSGSGTEGSVLPRLSGPGPRTQAERRELLLLATQALDTLPERDRELVRLTTQGVPLAEQAERLGLTYSATQRASLRATERLRNAMRALSPDDFETWRG